MKKIPSKKDIMRIQALYDLQQEINRLYIAGSKFAKGDPRLTKHLPVLQKLGEKAPVFKKLAQDIDELTNTDPAQSSEKLLNIGVLLYSILYTQGECTDDTVLEENTPYYDLEQVNTTASYLSLKPVIEALSSSKSGRLEVLQDAFQQGLFNDFRTFEFLDMALGDKYSDLADYVENMIIPAIGKPILPFIRTNFSTEGRVQDIRRLRLLKKLKETELASFVEESLNSKSIGLQTEAVRLLGDDINNESRIMLYADDKNKQIREAAYIALAHYNTKESKSKLNQLFLKNKAKTNLQGIVDALALLPELNDDVFEKIFSDFDTFLEKASTLNDKDLVNEFEKLQIEITVFRGKSEERTLNFAEKILTNSQFRAITKEKRSLIGGLEESLIEEMLLLLNQDSSGKGITIFEQLLDDKPTVKQYGAKIIAAYFATVAKQFTPEKMFDVFSNYYSSNQIYSDIFYSVYSEEKSFVLPWRRIISSYSATPLYYFSDSEFKFNNLDPRWIDLFIEKSKRKFAKNNDQEAQLAYYLAVYAMKDNDERLTEMLKNKLMKYQTIKVFQDDAHYFYRRMFDINYPDAANLLLTEIENKSKEINISYNQYFLIQKLRQFINYGLFKHFPKKYSERIQKLYDTYQLDIFWEILNIVNNN